MRRIFLNIISINIFILLIFSKIERINSYSENSWGNIYYLNENADFYIDEKSDYSIYRINKHNYLYCSSNNKETDRLFCWYIFDEKENPISGWIKQNYLEEK